MEFQWIIAATPRGLAPALCAALSGWSGGPPLIRKNLMRMKLLRLPSLERGTWFVCALANYNGCINKGYLYGFR